MGFLPLHMFGGCAPTTWQSASTASESGSEVIVVVDDISL
eukprot:COSAG01_NODE_1502_length_10101_cov_6.907119_6_plen_40_part_00